MTAKTPTGAVADGRWSLGDQVGRTVDLGILACRGPRPDTAGQCAAYRDGGGRGTGRLTVWSVHLAGKCFDVATIWRV